MNNIYVGNLAQTVTEDALRELFEPFGAVDSVRIIKDKFTGNSRGFGFVQMGDKDAAFNAIEDLNGKEIEGQNLKVSKAKPPEQRTGGGGRGGFGGPRGGNGGGGGSRGGFGGPRGGNGGGGGGRGGFGGGGDRW